MVDWSTWIAAMARGGKLPTRDLTALRYHERMLERGQLFLRLRAAILEPNRQRIAAVGLCACQRAGRVATIIVAVIAWQ